VNQGNSWSDVSGDLPLAVRGMCLAVDFAHSPPRLYLGTDYGVYSSIDDGAHWVLENNGGLPSLAVYDLELLPGGNGVVAATHGRGMWKGTGSLVAIGGQGATDQGLALSAPSPFRAPATVDFRLPAAGTASLEVFDLSGRRMCVIEHGVLAAGEHRTRWNGRDEHGATARDGIYFFRLVAGAGEKVLKFALLR